MIGINYRYEFNEKKNTIKLAPTRGVMITSLALMAVPYVYLGVQAVLVKLEERDAVKKTTFTEDHLPRN